MSPDPMLGDDDMLEENKEINKKIEDILKEIDKRDLSSKEIMYLVVMILEKEFNTPRPNIDVDRRWKSFFLVVDKVLSRHFTGLGALSFIASLGENLLRRHPELATRERDNGVV